MKKLANHIILSGVTVSMLFSPLMALPSGGKFTHGTSGTININGNNMDIMGNGKNSVIQWGGGFSIGQGESVNFGGNSKNYLNIAHGTSKSMIEGILNANGKNVFLINPNGVIITKTGTINANRFVASTSSMSDGEMKNFAKLTESQGASFSPIFKPHKAGNVVNMGNINANNVLLIGNKVDIQGGNINGKHNDGVSGDALKNPSGNTANKVHLVGNEVYIDKDMANFKIASGKVDITANTIYTQRQMINFANDKYIFGNNANINVINYTDSSGTTHTGSSNFKKALTIGNMGNEKDNAIEWWHFAKGWNEGLGDTRSVDEFRLVDDIDFSGNQGKGVEGQDWQNYANYCIDGLGCTSMIVGSYDLPSPIYFHATFDGQNHSLKNINMDFTLYTGGSHVYAGIFGYASNATFKNINIDYMGGGIKVNTNSPGEAHVGGFVGSMEGGIINNILLENISSIEHFHIGSGSWITTGGFLGQLTGGEISKITVRNISSIKTYAPSTKFLMTGGFIGHSRYDSYIDNILLENIKNISNEAKEILISSVGGFIGGVNDGVSLTNVKVDKIYNISNHVNSGEAYTGGFYGAAGSSIGIFKNIYIYFDPKTTITSSSNNIGIFFGYSEDYPAHAPELYNINIYYKNKTLSDANIDSWLYDKINFYVYNDEIKAYQDFLNKAGYIQGYYKDGEINLEQDDLNKEVITQIIEDITQKGYVVDIAMLEKLLEVYSKFNLNTTEGEKIAFIQTYFNIKDENEVRGILQSLDFLTHYTANGAFDKNRISNEAKDLFISLQNQSKTTLDNNKALFSYLNDNKDKLIAEYNKYKELEQIFKDKEQDYFKAQAEFNRLLDLVNKGLLKYNDPKFTQAFDNWLNAYNAYNALSNDISELNNNVASISNGVKDLGYTKFSFVKFDDITNIDIKEPEIPNIDNSQGGDLPGFKQTASLNLIGDHAIEEEENKEEIDENSLKQKGLTCIVSDNFKTMNPCIVGGL
ncbi:two-partner secretion domain-containing protein [Campylobacter lari]|uniref:two-partner secretion domain-containing protein n=1 Tax=Campylobacter lari TaxID=201 RepID=UPI000E11DAD6|nr:filamentous hemagglutinin N-terminal domain-containing protein [Campylobacter lari]SUX05894.1 hemagglutination domain protein [Campylobacter lari]